MAAIEAGFVNLRIIIIFILVVLKMNNSEFDFRSLKFFLLSKHL